MGECNYEHLYNDLWGNTFFSYRTGYERFPYDGCGSCIVTDLQRKWSCKDIFSVGQHCINCALEAEARGYSGRVVLACLLHDASEAYMSDVPRPFKQYLKEYAVFEDRLLTLVYQKYLGTDVTEEEQMLIRQIDNEILAYDLFYLLGEGGREDLPKLCRTFSYEVRPFEDVEHEYIELFQKWSDKL